MGNLWADSGAVVAVVAVIAVLKSKSATGKKRFYSEISTKRYGVVTFPVASSKCCSYCSFFQLLSRKKFFYMREKFREKNLEKNTGEKSKKTATTATTSRNYWKSYRLHVFS